MPPTQRPLSKSFAAALDTLQNFNEVRADYDNFLRKRLYAKKYGLAPEKVDEDLRFPWIRREEFESQLQTLAAQYSGHYTALKRETPLVALLLPATATLRTGRYLPSLLDRWRQRYA